MAKRVDWTITAREERKRIMDSYQAEDGDKTECKKLTLLIRTHLKFISKYNFAGIESKYPGMRQTTCGNCTLFYIIRSGSIIVTGIFKTEKIGKRSKKPD